jgi:hypothetical protein
LKHDFSTRDPAETKTYADEVLAALISAEFSARDSASINID